MADAKLDTPFVDGKIKGNSGGKSSGKKAPKMAGGKMKGGKC